MIQVLVVTTDKDSLINLKTACEENHARITWAESCDEVFLKLANENFDLIVTDETLADINGLDCIKKLIISNPLLNCAAISSLSSKDFHEASEGLGVLMQLPVRPEKENADRLFGHLKNILNLTKKVD
jgi:DNA-binding NtrC family response regulator